MESFDAVVILVSLVVGALAWGWVLRVALGRMGRKGLHLLWFPDFVKHLIADDPPVSRIPIGMLKVSVIGLSYSIVRFLISA